MLKLDMSNVGAIHQDFTRLTIKILSKQNYPLWEKSYQREESFNRTFRKINKLFSEELKQREVLDEKRNSRK